MRVGWAIRITLLAVLLLWLGARLWAVRVAAQREVLEQQLRAPLAALLGEPEYLEPSENSAPWIAAAALLGEPIRSSNLSHADLTSFDPALTQEQEADLREALRMNGKALELFAESARRSRCVFSPRLPDIYQARMNLIAVLDLAQLNIWRGRLAMAEGDPRTAAIALDQNLAVGGCLGSDLAGVSRLVGIAIERSTLSELARRVEQGDLDSELPLIRGRLESLRDPGAYELTLRAEGLGEDWSAEGAALSRSAGGPAVTFWIDPFAVRGFTAAMFDRARLELIDVVQRPEPPPEPATTESWVFAWNLDEAIVHWAGRVDWVRERRLRAIFDARRLALAALEVRERASAEGTYPFDAGDWADLATPTRWTGESLGYERFADGSARLSLPKSAAQDPTLATGARQYPFPWSWNLPPLPRTLARDDRSLSPSRAAGAPAR